MKPKLPLALLAAAALAGCAVNFQASLGLKPASPLQHPRRADDPPDVAPAQPVIPAGTFMVTDYGARGDSGATDSTEAFHKAIAAVQAAGGGTLIVPAAPLPYFTGAFDLCSNLNLRLQAGAKILFSPAFSDYRDLGNANRYRPLILARGLHDVLVSGGGTIDGNGEAWWPEARRFKAVANAHHASGNTSPRPVMLSFQNCQRIRIEGVTLTDAPVFNLVQNSCQDVTCEGLTILNPAIAPNTDGIDPKDCQRVLIEHCHIDTGDDNVALGGGAGPREEDVLIQDCQFFHGHGCSIGSGTGSGVRNVLVRRCSFQDTDTGVRLKSARGRGGVTENITYEDLTMNNVGVAISISSYYDNTPIESSTSRAAEAPAGSSKGARTPVWRNITVRDVIATNCRKSAGLIAGLSEAPVQDVTLEEVSIDAPAGLKVACTQNLALRHVTITPASGPDVIADATVSGLARTP
ncbi:MAG TPA: glycoside hydrolase family 28 protein [Opitutaceae bacterium]|nr:glycoside hydrolase family 28 protein [Opitutaceae bacterium]